MKIQAALLEQMGLPQPYAASRPLKIVELELDAPGPGEVLVRIRAAGLCHSDLSVIDGNRPRAMPMVIGHEAAGIIEQLGPGVTDLAVGDHVVTAFVPSCGHCLPCVQQRPALCEPGFKANGAGTLLSGARRFRDNKIHHHLGVSGFADHAVVARESCVRIDRSLPFAEAAVFGCAVITGVGAVVNTAQVQAGESVAVIGLGGVGLAAVLGAKRAGATPLIAIDLSDTKLAIAKDLGATHTFNASASDCAEQVRALLPAGVTHALEMAGSIKALELAWKITARGGNTVTAGLPHPDARLSISPVQLVVEERTLKGSYVGSCVPARDIPRYIEWYKQGELPVNRLLSERIRLPDINAAFDRLAAGQTIRQVVEFD
ncbi:MAG: zinc-dependent alcohol dehydrogenase family protein [Candidatus Obscuribacterales bacterium]|nr:zinc-dependent alcohol dehydrogenase family protein [Steroidobacteraceae bacterium]